MSNFRQATIWTSNGTRIHIQLIEEIAFVVKLYHGQNGLT
jgi:hypothetical protein